MCYKKDTMGNKRVADIIARTYFTNKEQRPLEKSGLVSAVGKYFNVNILLLGINIVLILLLILGWKSGMLYNSGVAARGNASSESLFVASDKMPVAISFDFSDTQANGVVKYYLSLKGADLSRFKALVFDVRFSSGKNHSIRIEFVNGFREIGEIGIPSIDSGWKEIVIPLEEVPKITSWNNVEKIGFIIDKWNVSIPKGTIYIDKVRFVEGT